jgi:3-dehydroquinate synthase
VQGALEGAGWRVAGTVEVPAGESSKSMGTYGDALRHLASLGLTRDSTIFALGGGVVGDLGGFVAGTYMRGIDLVMLPTSFLAMVDSAVGGKVGIDLPEGKNLVGAFVRPRLVVADLDWLATLPGREISNGLAETVKMGLLSGGDYFDDLGLIGAARKGDLHALRTLVLDSVRFKAQIVSEDELEGGLRAILNYGHTIGHALEAAAHYNLPHGSAVAAGMVAAANLSREHLGRDLTEVHEHLVGAAGLPRRVPDVGVDRTLQAMGRDKKRSATDGPVKHNFVLLEDIGQPVRDVPVTDQEAREAIGAVVE